MDEQDEHTADLLIYVMGLCDDLRDKGLITGGPRLSEEGRACYQALQASGFTATRAEIERCMAFLLAQS